MKNCAELMNDALLSSAVGKMNYKAIRSDAIQSTSKELAELMQRTLDTRSVFDLEHFFQYSKIRLQQGWPGVYGGTEIVLRSSQLYLEHMGQDVRRVMEQALRILYRD